MAHAPAHPIRSTTTPVPLLHPRGGLRPGAGREVQRRNRQGRRRAGEERVPGRAESVQAGKRAKGRQVTRRPPRNGARALRARRARQSRRHLRRHAEVRRRQSPARSLCTKPSRHLLGAAVGQAGRPATGAGRNRPSHRASAGATVSRSALQPRLRAAANESRRGRYRDAARGPSKGRREQPRRPRPDASSRIPGGHASPSRPTSRS